MYTYICTCMYMCVFLMCIYMFVYSCVTSSLICADCKELTLSLVHRTYQVFQSESSVPI